ncbi:MAG: KGK domain-containing protein, partial [Cyanobacteria bacterium P01_A01_bin.68]
MNDKNISIILDCDDDVVLFEKDTFKVSRLKELMIREVRRITDIQQNRNKNCVHRLLKQIKIGEESFNFYYIKFENTKNCQILQVNYKGWQNGKLNIEMC